MTGLTSSGRLEETPFAEIAGALFRSKSTGALTISSGERSRKVIFYEGSPVAVVSSNPKDHVARILAAKGKISKEDADRLQEIAETKEALLSVDFVSKETVTWGLKSRFVSLCYDLFRWGEGTFSFADAPPPRDLFLMKVPTPTLLMKGVKYMPPSALLEKVPVDQVLAPGSFDAADAGNLGSEESAFLAECREGREVQEVLDAGAIEAGRAREVLYAFVALGLVSLKAAVADEPVALEIEPSPEPEAAFELEPEPEAAFEPEPEPAFEIERTSYEEEQSAEPIEKTPLMEDGPSLTETEEETVTEESGELAPPDLEETQPGYAPAEQSVELQEPDGELTPPGLDLTPPLEGDEMPPPLEGGPDLEVPPPLDEEPSLEMPPPLDEEPSLEMPSPDDDMPTPPWQADTGAAKVGAAEEGRSPFASPDEDLPPEEEPPRMRERKEPKPKRSFAIPFRTLMIVALVGAAAFVAYGMWKGSSGPGSSSSGLEPIPEAEKIDYVKLAEELTVPAVPKSTPPPEKKEPAVVPASRPATQPVAVTKKPAATAKPAAPAAGGAAYEKGLSHFKAGSYEDASATWKTMLRDQGSVYTVQIVVACQIDTVKNAFSKFGSRKIFTVPLTLSGRTCYRVCYGTFPSKEAAAAAIDALPLGLQKDLSVKTAKSII